MTIPCMAYFSLHYTAISVFYRSRPVYRLFGAKMRRPEGDKSAAQRDRTYSSHASNDCERAY
ncbi:hypothetical protein KCP71_07540 [Salmonella enterica subsp. enterica]|nr:hypothetical protein KCP71_07540 [Salmonella enterica subsp. enterica]